QGPLLIGEGVDGAEVEDGVKRAIGKWQRCRVATVPLDVAGDRAVRALKLSQPRPGDLQHGRREVLEDQQAAGTKLAPDVLGIAAGAAADFEHPRGRRELEWRDELAPDLGLVLLEG